LNIQIKKNEQQHSFWYQDEEVSLQDVIETLKKTNKRMIYFETIENEQVLLSGYFIYTTDKQLKRQLKRAAKAQVTF
jgi:rRNA-processing protein FCF1